MNSSGGVTLVATPPAKSELGCSNITTATAVQGPGTSTYATTSSIPVYTGVPGGFNQSPYVQTPVTGAVPGAKAAGAGGGLLSNLPTWAIAAGAGVGGIVLVKMMGKR